MKYITHITLATGHTSRIQAGDVTGETLARVGPWLHVLAARPGVKLPLPVSSLADYMAHAAVDDGALLVTVSSPMGAPLVTIGVASRSRHAHLWDKMGQPVQGKMPNMPGIKCPPTPWCGIIIWTSALADQAAFEWLGDFERCVAWAWCHDGR